MNTLIKKICKLLTIPATILLILVLSGKGGNMSDAAATGKALIDQKQYKHRETATLGMG